MKKTKLKKRTVYKFYILFFAFLFFTHNAEASGASFSISPQNGIFTQGSNFDVSVFINTAGNTINTVRVDLQFDPQKLQVVTPAKGLSLVSNWIYPPNFSNTKGTINLQGGFPGGINTSQGLITIVTFKAVSVGDTIINFSDSSMILLNDAQGTNILTSFNRSIINIISSPPAGPQIFSETHPDQNSWYKNSNPSFSWEPVKGEKVGYSYEFNDDPYGEPDNVIDNVLTSVTFENITEGIQYFHLKAQKDQIWGGTSHFKLMIDKTPPMKFNLYVEPSSSNVRNYLSIYFNTTDLLSGIDYYEAKIANVTNPENIIFSGWTLAESPFQLTTKNPGTFEMLFRAFDKAGNFQEERTKVKIINDFLVIANNGIIFKEILIPKWIIYFLTLAINFAFGFLIYLLIKWIKKKIKKNEINLDKEIKEAEKEIADVKETEEKLRQMRIREEGAAKEYERLKESLNNEIKKDQ